MDANIRMELIKLANGERVLRIEHPASGLCLEKRLEAGLPVIAQKQRWCRAFEALLARELTAV